MSKRPDLNSELVTQNLFIVNELSETQVIFVQLF